MKFRSARVSIAGSPKSGKVTLTGLPPWILGPSEDPETPVEPKIVKPTAVQEHEGLAKLKQCMPIWVQTPALLVIKPTLGLIVAVIGSVEYNDWGFQLRLKVLERLEAPSEFNKSEVPIACGWNQPYMTFDEFELFAPYCFYLHFGTEGVDRAREFSKVIQKRAGDNREAMLGCFRACFSPFWPDDWASIIKG